ncbi:inositol-pentakisphosphate 2-kinase-like [Malania oleifera]|uniref:inositol-pentakisphosphate 2-kinase-like n=1 Tax=Malania oleifera TaxID=397392 RepID=UPI0025AE6B6F|nr:inositol-pentakisphosphate 2-kinase-like [Malania oleifera]
MEAGEVVLDQNDAAHWIYRGEGAVNLVFAYTGSSPLFAGKVLRIQKVPRKKSQCASNTSVLSVYECRLWKDANDIVSSPTKDIAGQLYVQNVMSPLLGSKHVDSGMRVRVSRDFLESVEKNVLSQRPTWRVDAAKINTLCDSALLMSDHSVFCQGTVKGEPSISIEIKPKCGFLPFSRFIAEGNDIKRSVSRFRMHQLLKLHHKEISQISEYDPLDLFSGSKDRIYKAIMALFTTPQNNLRVFLNGSLAFGGLGGGSDSTYFVNSEALESALMHAIRAEDGLRTMRFIELVAETVFKSKVLDLLLKVQKLDNFDIEGAIHAYYDVVSQPCMICRDMGEDNLLGKYAALHSISLDESLQIVRDYLIAATAKDCSLMISFTSSEDGIRGSPYNDVYLESTNQNFHYKANFIDLDMKPLKKMELYYELDQKIVNYYVQMAKIEHEPEEAANIEV